MLRTLLDSSVLLNTFLLFFFFPSTASFVDAKVDSNREASSPLSISIPTLALAPINLPMSTPEIALFNLDPNAIDLPIGESKDNVKAWLKRKNTAAQNLQAAKALLSGAFSDMPIPENGVAILAKLSEELDAAHAGLKECRRVRALTLAKEKRDAAKANADRFRAAAIAATFAASGEDGDNGSGESGESGKCGMGADEARAPSPDSPQEKKRKMPGDDYDFRFPSPARMGADEARPPSPYSPE